MPLLSTGPLAFGGWGLMLDEEGWQTAFAVHWMFKLGHDPVFRRLCGIFRRNMHLL